MMRRRSVWAGRTLLVLAILALLVPVYWLVKSAFSTNEQLFADPPSLFPSPPTLAGFAEILPVIVPDLGTSAGIALGCVALTLVVAMPTAFGLTLLREQGGTGRLPARRTQHVDVPEHHVRHPALRRLLSSPPAEHRARA